jgi:glyoxylase-like metal-dependent hydrolase (beta-lactamase superfamily II)
VPHGSIRIGSVEIVALCDGVVLASRPATESFPGIGADVLAEARERYPAVFHHERWRLHVHAFLLRSGGRTILVDAGIGPESVPAYSWSHTRGALPEELSAAGVTPTDVDTLVVTHVHDDHLGWSVAEGSSEPMFPNARYLIHRADWDLMATTEDEEDRVTFDAVLAPLDRAGVLQLTGAGLRLTPEIGIVHAPGHTPGHQILLVDDGSDRAIVSGDLVNHPGQLLQPGLNGTSDFEPERAAATRAAFLERVDREDRVVAAAHLPEALGRVVRDGDRWAWRALDAAGGDD